MYMRAGSHTTLEGIARELNVGPRRPLCSPNTGTSCYNVHIIIDGFPKKLYRKEAAEQPST